MSLRCLEWSLILMLTAASAGCGDKDETEEPPTDSEGDTGEGEGDTDTGKDDSGDTGEHDSGDPGDTGEDDTGDTGGGDTGDTGEPLTEHERVVAAVTEAAQESCGGSGTSEPADAGAVFLRAQWGEPSFAWHTQAFYEVATAVDKVLHKVGPSDCATLDDEGDEWVIESEECVLSPELTVSGTVRRDLVSDPQSFTYEDFEVTLGDEQLALDGEITAGEEDGVKVVRSSLSMELSEAAGGVLVMDRDFGGLTGDVENVLGYGSIFDLGGAEGAVAWSSLQKAELSGGAEGMALGQGCLAYVDGGKFSVFAFQGAQLWVLDKAGSDKCYTVTVDGVAQADWCG